MDPNKSILVSTSYDEEMKRIVVKIQDEGIGISSENLSQITDPFFSTKQDLGGVGLGLSISSKIVEDHNGQMIFDTKIGMGTTVEIILPVHEKTKH